MVSEETIFLKSLQTDDGHQVMAIAHMTLWVRWAKNKVSQENYIYDWGIQIDLKKCATKCHSWLNFVLNGTNFITFLHRFLRPIKGSFIPGTSNISLFSYIFISFNSALFYVSFSISFLATNKPYPNISDEDVGKTGREGSISVFICETNIP